MKEAKRVVPIIAVGILTFHPDPCWIIISAQRKAVMARDRELLVFSNEVVAHTFMLGEMRLKSQDYVLEQLYWNDLVDRFSEQFSHALVDCRGKSVVESKIPLRKEILCSWNF